MFASLNIEHKQREPAHFYQDFIGRKAHGWVAMREAQFGALAGQPPEHFGGVPDLVVVQADEQRGVGLAQPAAHRRNLGHAIAAMRQRLDHARRVIGLYHHNQQLHSAVIVCAEDVRFQTSGMKIR